MIAEHRSRYQERDWEVIDYHMYHDPGTGLSFRGPGPRLLSGKDYIACVGAAQTFGCFCKYPYPQLLERALDVDVLNLGYGGASAAFFLKYPALIEKMNQARFVILQVMSGRSESNSIFDAGGLEYLTRREDSERMSADRAYQWLLDRHRAAPEVPRVVEKAFRVFRGPAEVREILQETRKNWVLSYLKLLEQITVPVVLLWMSKRRPGLHWSQKGVWWWQRYDGVGAMLGEFPQLVNSPMVKAVRAKTYHYIESVSRRGSPQTLRSRFSGEIVEVDHSKDRPEFNWSSKYNSYYPSPAMHEDAFSALLPTCQRLLVE